jgi:hypothetical protein
MGLPSILDLAIGLIFIYLILSLLASELQELLTTLLQWRAKHLKEAIEILLAGGAGTKEEDDVRELVQKLYDDPLLKNVNQEAKGAIARGVRQVSRLLIPGNRKGAFGVNQSTGPSYISAETFATSLIERLGLSTLIKTLLHVRLSTFKDSIIRTIHSIVDNTNDDQSSKSDEHTDSSKEHIDLSKDKAFKLLTKDYDTIVSDFKESRATLTVCIERMGECLENYIQSVDKQALYVQRLTSYRQTLFGQTCERAWQSGGLCPSLAEIAELIDRSSATYKEIGVVYKEMVTKAEPIEAKVNPALEAALIADWLEVLEAQLLRSHLDLMETQLKAKGFNIKPVSTRGKINSQRVRLLKRQHYLRSQLEGLDEEQRRQIIQDGLDQLSPQQRITLITETLSALSNEQRHLVVGDTLEQLVNQQQLTEDDCRIYENYQTYKAIERVLDQLPNSVKESFAILARRAQSRVKQTETDVSQLRQEVSIWFDRSMNRASGVYKRNAKGVAIAIGLILATLTNTDTFYIVDRLSNDENLRDIITRQAIQVAPSPDAATTEDSLELARGRAKLALQELNLPVGWRTTNLIGQFNCQANEQRRTTTTNLSQACFNRKTLTSTPQLAWQLVLNKPLALSRMVLGWLITGLAISMGASFWFELLGKVVNVRNTGYKPPSPIAPHQTPPKEN